MALLLHMSVNFQCNYHGFVDVQAHSSLEFVEASVTIAMGGMDKDIVNLLRVRKFIEEECIVGFVFHGVFQSIDTENPL